MLLADRHHGLRDSVRGLLEAEFETVFMVANEVSLLEGAGRAVDAGRFVPALAAAGGRGRVVDAGRVVPGAVVPPVVVAGFGATVVHTGTRVGLTPGAGEHAVAGGLRPLGRRPAPLVAALRCVSIAHRVPFCARASTGAVARG